MSTETDKTIQTVAATAGVKSSTRLRTTRRTAVAAGLALVLGLGVAAQASAGGSRSVSGKPSDNVTRIANFYGAYIDAVIDEDGKLADDLRKHYLTPAFQKELQAWEDKNHANGVLQAQNVPLAWKVTDNGTANYTEAVVTLTWGGDHTTQLIVDMSRESHKIFHIGTKGAEVG
ncbi:hypothetical protein ACWGH3_28940 [Streptomyces sp. NPDC054884]|uniref:hypothetical protein n=1 Tax=Streptomyces sp. ME08-AFT2 TaxID=3028683 RepID=UPI0029B54B8B|nr:hypothetical protein [Streptomyces sp. ME08-AFT2]MDX3311344.1 hypothetical protein [Streptomyces sp. ME08-AFT2]